MALTRNFKTTVVTRAHNDPNFAKLLLEEAVALFLSGETDLAKQELRDLVNATIGFAQLSKLVGAPPKSLHRMLSPAGNPTMSHLSAIFSALKTAMAMEIQIQAIRIG